MRETYELKTTKFRIRKLTAEDVESIYNLCCGNPIFYQYHPPFVTREHILEDMDALPPGKTCEDKYYIGFFSGNHLVAVMDLILDYPEKRIAWIGFFMVDIADQGKGIGSEIVRECVKSLKEFGYNSVQLGVDWHNPQSNSFWKKNGFITIEEGRYIKMEKI